MHYLEPILLDTTPTICATSGCAPSDRFQEKLPPNPLVGDSRMELLVRRVDKTETLACSVYVGSNLALHDAIDPSEPTGQHRPGPTVPVQGADAQPRWYRNIAFPAR